MAAATEKQKKSRIERYRKLKAEGLCVTCAAKPATEGTLTCTECRSDHKKYYREAKNLPNYRAKHRRQLRQWRDQNLSYCRKSRRMYLKKLRDEVFVHYGSKCVCCGEKEFVFLSIDHIRNDGKKDREKTHGAGGNRFYRRIQLAGYPKTLQILCHNCNQAKRILGYCPHHAEWPRTHVWYGDHCANCDKNKTTKLTKVACVPIILSAKRHPNPV